MKSSTHLRVNKRVSLGKHLKANVGKTGISLSIPLFPGLCLNLGKTGLTVSAGLPGTGISTRTKVSKDKPAKVLAKSKAK